MPETPLGRALVDDFHAATQAELADSLALRLLTQAAELMSSGQPVATTERESYAAPAIAKLGLSDIDSDVDAFYAVEAIEKRGAWYLPEGNKTLGLGWCNAHLIRGEDLRWIGNRTGADEIRCDLHSSPTAVALWSLLIPFAEDVWAPVVLRLHQSKPKPAAKQRRNWAEVSANLSELGIEVNLERIAYGGDWSKSKQPERSEMIATISQQITTQISGEVARRWYFQQLRQLAAAFYQKTKREPATSEQVLTKGHQQRLIGLFGGDWFTFLDQIGELPNPSEQRLSELPKPRIYVDTRGPNSEAIEGTGIDADEAAAMKAALLGGAQAANALPERTAFLRNWWLAIADAYRLHTPEQGNYHSLLGGGFFSVDDYRVESPPYLYRNVLPKTVVTDVERLWDGRVLPRWPEIIASEFNPSAVAAEAFGAASKFWHDALLTCWYDTEGPHSTSSVGDLARAGLASGSPLDPLGFPVDASLFEELAAIDSALGDKEPVNDVLAQGMVTITMSMGSRRDGYSQVREIVIRYLDQWNATHLGPYLDWRWRSELETVAEDLNRRHAAGKKPTTKQLGKLCAGAANHWFGGDVRALLRAIGEPSPFEPQRRDLLVGDPLAFVQHVYVGLGGRPAEEWSSRAPYEEESKLWTLRAMARDSLKLLQHREASGEWPQLGVAGAGNYDWHLIGREPDPGWTDYLDLIDDLRGQDLQPMVDSRRNGLAPQRAGRIGSVSGSGRPNPPTPKPPSSKKGILGRLFGSRDS